MYSGDQTYSDLEPPWTPVVQSDWSGGKGAKNFDRDSTKYHDGYGVNTIRDGEVILGPKATSTLNDTTPMSNTESATVNLGAGGINYFALKFTASATITVATVTVKASIAGDLSIAIIGVSGSAPDTAPGSISFSDVKSSIIQTLETYTFTLATPKALTSGTSYFLVFNWVPLGMTQFIYGGSTTSDDYFPYSVVEGWVQSADKAIPYFVMETATSLVGARYRYFEYKGALYAVSQPDNGTGSKLYLNGDQGVIKAGSSVTSVVTDSGVATWGANDTNCVGSILKIVSGTGASQPQNWSYITANTATNTLETTFTVSPAFSVAPAANDIYVIVASNEWTEIAGFDASYKSATSGIVPTVTDVLSVNGAIYFAMGDNAVITRVYAYNNSGAWTYNYSDFGTYTAGSVTEDATNGKFSFLSYYSDQSGTYVLGATRGYPPKINRAPAIDYSGVAGSLEAPLVWGTSLNVGNTYERITGVEIYGEYGNPYIFKEASAWQIIDWKGYLINISEMGRTADDRNGVAHCVAGVYLYFSWHDTVERFYNGLLDGVGPERAEVAIPTGNRAGNFSSLVSYPGIIIGTVDAGKDGVSTVLAYNGKGWCELYRATTGKRIQTSYIQSIPGIAVDRLWLSVGETIIWMPISIDPYNHPSDGYNPYLFNTSGDIITAWYYLGLQAVDKLFNSIRVVAECMVALGTSTEDIEVSYMTDNDDTDGTDWTSITTHVTQFSQELDLAATPSVSGKRIRFKFTLKSHDGANTPRMLATVLEAIVRLPVKYSTTLTFLLEDDQRDLRGNLDNYQSHNDRITALETMMNQATPITVTSISTQLNGRTAFVDSINVSPTSIPVKTHTGDRECYIGRMVLIEA